MYIDLLSSISRRRTVNDTPKRNWASAQMQLTSPESDCRHHDSNLWRVFSPGKRVVRARTSSLYGPVPARWAEHSKTLGIGRRRDLRPSWTRWYRCAVVLDSFVLPQKWHLDLGSKPSEVKFIKKDGIHWNSSNLCAHVSEIGPDLESVPTLSGPVSAWSSVPLRFHAWRWKVVVRVITSMYPPSVHTPFPKYGNCFGKWALA